MSDKRKNQAGSPNRPPSIRGLAESRKLSMLNAIHGGVLAVDDFINAAIDDLNPRIKDDRVALTALICLKRAISPFIDGLAELDVYSRK